MATSRERGLPRLFDDQVWFETAERLGLTAHLLPPSLQRRRWPTGPLSEAMTCASSRVERSEFSREHHFLTGIVRGHRVVVHLCREEEKEGANALAWFPSPLLMGTECTLFGNQTALDEPLLESVLARARSSAAYVALWNAMRARDRGVEADLDDHRVRVFSRRLLEGRDDLAEHVEMAVVLAEAIAEARRETPPGAREAPLLRGLEALAKTEGIDFRRERLAVAGRFGVHRFDLGLSLDGGRPSTELHVVFDPPLGFELSVSRETLLDKLHKLVSLEDVVTGDPAFDRTFLVQGTPKETIRERLDADARAALLSLVALGATVSVTQAGLRARFAGYLAEPAEALAHAGAATERLTRVLGASPYR